MFNNFKNILIGILAAVVVIAIGASTYNTYANGGFSLSGANTQPVYGQAWSQSQGGMRGGMMGQGTQNQNGMMGQGRGNGQGGMRQGMQGQGMHGQNGAGQGGMMGQGGIGQANIANATTIKGVVNSFDGTGFEITTDDGQTLYVQVGNSTYAQSIGFAPQAGTEVTVNGFVGDQGNYAAITVTIDGKVYTFREATGRPAWAGGGNGNGNGGNQ